MRAASGRDALPLLQFTLSRLYEGMRERLAAAGKTLASARQRRSDADLRGLSGVRRPRRRDRRARRGDVPRPRSGRAGTAAAPAARACRGRAGRRRKATRPAGCSLFEVADRERSPPTRPRAALVDALIAARMLVASAPTDAGGQRHVRLAHEAVLRTWERAREIVAEHADFFRIRADLDRGRAALRAAARRAGGRSADAFLLPAGCRWPRPNRFARDSPTNSSPNVVAVHRPSGRRARRRQRLLAAASVVFAMTAVRRAASAPIMAVRSEQRAARNFDARHRAGRRAGVADLPRSSRISPVSRDALRRDARCDREAVRRDRQDQPEPSAPAAQPCPHADGFRR